MEADAIYKDIIEIHTTYSSEDVNRRLAAGWVLLNLESHQSGAHDWNSKYILGWPKTCGPVVHPNSLSADDFI